MKHIRNFRNFSVNEMQDWTTLPVDVHAGMADLYGQVGREIKSALGSGYQKFVDKIEELCRFSLSTSEASQMLKSAEKFFGQDPTKLTADEVKKALEKKFPTKFTTLKESLADKYDETDPYETKTGEEESFGKTRISDVKGGIVQKIGHILQFVFMTNVFTFGFLGSWVSSLIGLGVTTNGFFTPYSPIFTMFLSIVAFTIVHIIRKLHKMVVGYK